MQQRKSKRARGHLGRGALFSLLLHAHVLVPLTIAAIVLGRREAAQRAEEVDVAFDEAAPEELPPGLPPLEPPRATPEPPPARTPPEKKKKPKLAPPDKRMAQTPPKPEPELVVPPMPPMPKEEPPPPPPKPEERGHEKMVDLDSEKEVPPPPDAKFLAQKNNRAEVETRAKDTNLEKAQKGEAAASAPSERQDEQVGGEKEMIRQLDEQKSLAGKKAPEVTPHVNPEVAQPEQSQQRQQRSLLALRDNVPRAHELTPETADPSLPRAPDGDVAAPSKSVRGRNSDPAEQKQGKQVKLALSGKDFEYLFGADAEAERRLAQKIRSNRQGRFQQKQARIAAALENFIPEVQPGNQTALNTRAAPFAAFIARMHRSIHQQWGFGQLEEWDEKPSSAPVNNQNLLTTLEMVLNGDGTVDKITIVKPSGLLEYDVAAIDVAYSAGPYPDPPREIRSANGKIYIHWRFYRDGRQCATSGVDYFILNNPPAGGDKPAVGDLGAAKRPQVPHALGPAKSEEGGGGGGLRRLTRDDNPAHAAKIRQLNQEVAAAEAAGASGGGGAPAEQGPAVSPTSGVPRTDDPAARAIAEGWFGALASGNVARMGDLAAFPFRTSSGGSVKTRGELTTMLTDLASELPRGRRHGDVQLFTAAGLRAEIGGKLPPGLDDGSGLLFALAPSEGGHDVLVLVLGRRTAGWRAVGFVRR
jgi:hypothetical protein